MRARSPHGWEVREAVLLEFGELFCICSHFYVRNDWNEHFSEPFVISTPTTEFLFRSNLGGWISEREMARSYHRILSWIKQWLDSTSGYMPGWSGPPGMRYLCVGGRESLARLSLLLCGWKGTQRLRVSTWHAGRLGHLQSTSAFWLNLSNLALGGL